MLWFPQYDLAVNKCCILMLLKYFSQTGEMAQRVKGLAANHENSSLIPATHTVERGNQLL